MSTFYLAGGTATALHFGHRLSVDLDFFSGSLFEPEDLISAFEHDGVELFEIEPGPKTLHCNIEKTKASFLYYPYPLIEKCSVFESVKVAAPIDIALMKITAIASRSTKRDFIDLAFLLKKHSLNKLLEEFQKKFPAAKFDPYHYLRSLTYFDDAEHDPMPAMLVPCDWNRVKKDIERAVAGLS